jgi:hypothetical protein
MYQQTLTSSAIAHKDVSTLNQHVLHHPVAEAVFERQFLLKQKEKKNEIDLENIVFVASMTLLSPPAIKDRANLTISWTQ